MTIPKTELAVAASPTEKRSNSMVVTEWITLHSTHSSISYFPRVSCVKKFFFFCSPKFEPWVLAEYFGMGSQRHSFRLIKNGHRDEVEDDGREVHFSARGEHQEMAS